jgi:hypothetical protein
MAPAVPLIQNSLQGLSKCSDLLPMITAAAWNNVGIGTLYTPRRARWPRAGDVIRDSHHVK